MAGLNTDDDPRWRRTREAILRAGEELFGHHQAEGVSIDELVRTAKISKQSFYNHFADKDALGHEILRIARSDVDALVTAANDGQSDPARRLVTGLCVYAKRALSNPTQARLIARLMLDDLGTESETNAHLVADVRAGLSLERLAVFTLETGLSFVLGVGQALIWRIANERHPGLAVTTSQQFCTLTLRAFGLPPIEAELIAAEAADRIIQRDWLGKTR